VVVTGGQAPAHAPEHADVFPLSFAHKYTARPEPSVSTLPADVVAVVITVAPDPLPAALAAAELAAAELLLLPPPLAQAAASTATAAAPPTPVASLAAGDSRIHMEFAIIPPVRRGQTTPVPTPPTSVETDTG
jgi:hypothetical protein